MSAGGWIIASGEWINDRAHGQQLKQDLKTSARRAVRAPLQQPLRSRIANTTIMGIAVS
jgi:hypothetical protein